MAGTNFNPILELIAAGKTEQALEQLIPLYKDNENYSSVILISDRFKRIQKQYHANLISQSEFDKELNRLNFTIVSLSKEFMLEEKYISDDFSPSKSKKVNITLEQGAIELQKLSRELDELKKQIKSSRIIVSDNVFTSKILQGDNKAIIDYYTELAESEETELYEARLLIIGEPRSGKTTLQRKLKNIAADLPQLDESTKGISEPVVG